MKKLLLILSLELIAPLAQAISIVNNTGYKGIISWLGPVTKDSIKIADNATIETTVPDEVSQFVFATDNTISTVDPADCDGSCVVNLNNQATYTLKTTKIEKDSLEQKKCTFQVNGKNCDS